MSDNTLNDVLERKGTIQIIVEIGRTYKTFDQIEETVLVSSSTVSNRLKEGVDKDLFSVTYNPTDHGTQKRYQLTKNGKIILDLILELDVDSTVRKYQRVTRRFDQEKDNLLQHVNRHTEIIPDGIPHTVDIMNNIPPVEEVPEEHQAPTEENIDYQEKRRQQLEKNLIGEIEYINEGETDDGENEDDSDSQ